MKLLSELQIGEKARVERIEGGKEIKGHLEDLGLTEGTQIEVLSLPHAHEHRGAVSALIGEREVIMGQGMADKIYVEKGGALIPLLGLEEGDEGVIRSLHGGKDLERWISRLGIKEGKGVKFLRHLPDRTLVIETGGKAIKMGEGQASKIIVGRAGETIQINYLKDGERAKVAEMVGGAATKEAIEEMGIKEGVEVIMKAREETSTFQERANYLRIKVGDESVTIGHGMAQKVWVE